MTRNPCGQRNGLIPFVLRLRYKKSSGQISACNAEMPLTKNDRERIENG